jgi:hypothetical protein
MLKQCRYSEPPAATGSDADGEFVYFLRAGNAIKIDRVTKRAVPYLRVDDLLFCYDIAAKRKRP